MRFARYYRYARCNPATDTIEIPVYRSLCGLLMMTASTPDLGMYICRHREYQCIELLPAEQLKCGIAQYCYSICSDTLIIREVAQSHQSTPNSQSQYHYSINVSMIIYAKTLDMRRIFRTHMVHAQTVMILIDNLQ